MVFLKDSFEKDNLKKKSTDNKKQQQKNNNNKKHAKLPSMQRVKS